jgi:hypothetical protein
MSMIKVEMPVMARHEGEWSGAYTLVDTEGNRTYATGTGDR